MEASDRSLYEKTYANMSVGEGILTGEAAKEKAKNRRPKQSEVTYLEDGDVVEFGNDGRIIVSEFGPQVPVIVTSKAGEKRGLAFFLSTFGKSFVLTNKDGKYEDEAGNPSTTPVRIKTTGKPAEVYTSASNVYEAYEQFFGKKVKFNAIRRFGERLLWDSGKRVGKEITEQTVFNTEWV